MYVFDSGRRGRVSVRSLWVSRQQFPVLAPASLSSLNIVSLRSYSSSVYAARSTRLNPPASTISLYLKYGRNSESCQIQISEAAGGPGECAQPSSEPGQTAGQCTTGQGADQTV